MHLWARSPGSFQVPYRRRPRKRECRFGRRDGCFARFSGRFARRGGRLSHRDRRFAHKIKMSAISQFPLNSGTGVCVCDVRGLHSVSTCMQTYRFPSSYTTIYSHYCWGRSPTVYTSAAFFILYWYNHTYFIEDLMTIHFQVYSKPKELWFYILLLRIE